MHMTTIKLVTIITEAALESTLITQVETIGASGYTITNARGRGHRGKRQSSWESDANIRIEILAEPEAASKLIEFMTREYYENYAMVLFCTDVEVLRPEKF